MNFSLLAYVLSSKHAVWSGIPAYNIHCIFTKVTICLSWMPHGLNIDLYTSPIFILFNGHVKHLASILNMIWWLFKLSVVNDMFFLLV